MTVDQNEDGHQESVISSKRQPIAQELNLFPRNSLYMVLPRRFGKEGSLVDATAEMEKLEHSMR